jgi:hypothetical protein
MKNIDDWVEEIIDDVLVPYGTCEHNEEADEYGTRVNVSYDIEEQGKRNLWLILYKLKMEMLARIFDTSTKARGEND